MQGRLVEPDSGRPVRSAEVTLRSGGDQVFAAATTDAREMVNLTNEPLVAHQGTPDRPIQMEYYEPWGRIGLRMSW